MKSRGLRRILGTMGVFIAVVALSACNSTEATDTEASSDAVSSAEGDQSELKTIDELRIMFVL